MMSRYGNTAGLLLIVIISNFVAISKQNPIEFDGTVLQVNVVFRHGDRTSDVLYPSFPYALEDFYPFGMGGLTNIGKARSYEFGELLRQKYDNFLGTTYIPGDVQALSSNVGRTKMTLQLVLAGLYPPNPQQKWKTNLNWQPIPTNYNEKLKDYLFQRRHICKAYLTETEKVLRSPEMVEKLASFDDLLENMTILTGKNMTDIESLYRLYINLISLEAMGLELPNWTRDFYPSGKLYDAMITSLEVQNYNDVVKRLHGGGFVRQISENMVKKKNDRAGEYPKINLYSGHDVNVLALLSSLDLAQIHLPQFASAVVVELLSKHDEYFVNIWYYWGIPSQMQNMKIPGCSIPCPLDKFLDLTKNMIPSDEEFICYK